MNCSIVQYFTAIGIRNIEVYLHHFTLDSTPALWRRRFSTALLKLVSSSGATELAAELSSSLCVCADCIFIFLPFSVGFVILADWETMIGCDIVDEAGYDLRMG